MLAYVQQSPHTIFFYSMLSTNGQSTCCTFQGRQIRILRTFAFVYAFPAPLSLRIRFLNFLLSNNAWIRCSCGPCQIFHRPGRETSGIVHSDVHMLFDQFIFQGQEKCSSFRALCWPAYLILVIDFLLFSLHDVNEIKPQS